MGSLNKIITFPSKTLSNINSLSDKKWLLLFSIALKLKTIKKKNGYIPLSPVSKCSAISAEPCCTSAIHVLENSISQIACTLLIFAILEIYLHQCKFLKMLCFMLVFRRPERK